MVADDARSVTFEGFPLVIVVILLVFLFFAILSVSVRTYVRMGDNAFGLDDGLLALALVSWAAEPPTYNLCRRPPHTHKIKLTDKLGHLDNIHHRHCACNTWSLGRHRVQERQAQHMDAGRSRKVLHHLDYHIRRWRRSRQVLCVHHPDAHSSTIESVHVYRHLVPLGSDLGIILCHIFWHLDILQTRGGQLEHCLGHRGQSKLRRYGNSHWHKPHKYCHQHPD